MSAAASTHPAALWPPPSSAVRAAGVSFNAHAAEERGVRSCMCGAVCRGTRPVLHQHRFPPRLPAPGFSRTWPRPGGINSGSRLLEGVHAQQARVATRRGGERLRGGWETREGGPWTAGRQGKEARTRAVSGSSPNENAQRALAVNRETLAHVYSNGPFSISEPPRRWRTCPHEQTRPRSSRALRQSSCTLPSPVTCNFPWATLAVLYRSHPLDDHYRLLPVAEQIHVVHDRRQHTVVCSTAETSLAKHRRGHLHSKYPGSHERLGGCTTALHCASK
ncbi:hypothetical protein BD413DRAFT_166698 [Trametes elegans]|nr:hypothetical protein BD413DRAFT_166698 [Trametes elegans]